MEAFLSAIETEKIRNLTIVGHGGCGKTTFTESLLFNMEATTRMGSIDAGNTVSDYRKEEIDRHISISSTLMTCDYQGYRINIIDTPGFMDFIAEAKGPIRAADTVVVVLNALNGVEVGTEQVWEFAEESKRPCVIIINGLDRENTKFEQILQEAKNEFGSKVSAVQFPLNPGEGFDKILDLLSMKVLKFERDSSGRYAEEDIPGNLKSQAEELRKTLMENVAEADDELLEAYFEAGELTQEQFLKGLRKGIAKGAVVPVFCSSAISNIGSKKILEYVWEILPHPLEVPLPEAFTTVRKDKAELEADKTSAFVWKTISEAHVGELSLIRVFSGKVESGVELANTTNGGSEKIGQIFLMMGKNRKQVDPLLIGEMGAIVKLKNTHTGDTLCDSKAKIRFSDLKFPEPVIRTAVVPKTKGDEEKISTGLQNIREVDPSFVVAYDPELQQTIIAGQGELHLEVVISRLKDKFGVDVLREDPRIPYRETIKGSAEAEGKHKKQSGGRGQFGVVNVKLEPLPRGQDFEFVDAIFGGAIPSKFIPAVEKGIRERMEKGVVAGYKVVDVRVTLFDGKFHDVDSSELAFKIAGSLGFSNAFKICKPVILEPIYDIEVRVPEEYMGDVMGDISSKRGKILGMEAIGKMQIIKAKVPLAELSKYSTNLRSMTQGRGMHRQKFSHYEEVPGEVQNKLVEVYEKARAEGTSEK
jgi:elongation factor G